MPRRLPAVAVAVDEIQNQAEQHPADKSQPGDGRQKRHDAQTRQHAQNRDDRHEGRPEGTPQLRTNPTREDRKSTRLNSSHGYISYAVFCLKKKKEPVTWLEASHSELPDDEGLILNYMTL